ncbi:integrase core domain-containing protein [Streptomyces sp. NPDC102360]|uniref:integrase core domain-containing protein n=1 Tax=Streptomyces sp. NPDC102360 TaxID=3366160 RepID=UPI00381D23BF
MEFSAGAILAVDFFHVDTVLGRRLYAMAFLEHGTRRLHIAGVTAHPTREWAVQQARNVAADLGTRMETLRFLLRDRDSKYGQSFDAVFEADDMDVLLSAPQAPRMNAHCERVIGSIRREALDNILIMNATHARQVLAAYQRHYNGHRPHRARNQQPPDALHQPATVHDIDARKLLRTQVLSGAINEYRYVS